MLDEGVARDAVAPLFHVAEVVEGPIARQAELFERRQGIEHRRRRALLVARAQAVNNAILVLALKWVPLPLRRIGHADGIDMAVVEQRAWSSADAPQDIAHAIVAHFVKAQIGHARANGLAHGTNLAVVAGYGH